MDRKQKIKLRKAGYSLALIMLLLVLFLFIMSVAFKEVSGVVGENATVPTYLNVGNVYPEVLNVSIQDDAASFTLTANSTTTLYCISVLRDFNGEGTFSNVYSQFYDTSASNFSFSTPDDNNYHYTNSSCNITTSFGTFNGYADDAYSALGNCTFEVEYYANPGDWTCTVFVNDTTNLNATHNDTISINDLLAVGLPSSINYGTVNATEVSSENITDVINYGNVRLNLSLTGYGATLGDNLSMNCSLGTSNISVEHEKYNLTASTAGQLSLTQVGQFYQNLTGNTTIKRFNLDYRRNDTESEAINQTYWRIYVPVGAAGSCSGNIIFGAVQATGTGP
jgi:hypothetical protein